MEAILSKQLRLAKSLKQLCKNGKETDPVKSADVLHQFGLLYKAKSPDKLSLIRSAGFLNAAIVRQPSNTRFVEDLNDLCSQVLRVSRAHQKNADLVEISKDVALQVHQLRTHTNEQLNLIQIIPVDLSEETENLLQKVKIELIKRLQHEIFKKYSSIMEYISNKCITIMGNPPCEYSVVGMGSLARKEITPYSDFEHVIVLEEGVQLRDNYSDILEYFRWFSVIFQIIIINLQETIIRSLAVPLLNDFLIPGGDWFFDKFTKNGISFDGMQTPACKFPLGRTEETDYDPWMMELIKPVSDMAKYLETEEDIKNGYHLADILTKTCFVSGYKSIYDQFKKEVEIVVIENKSLATNQINKQVKEDSINFDAFSSSIKLFKNPNIDIKRMIYRTATLFISALGRLHSIDANSCFDVIDGLLKKELIIGVTAHKLSFAIAVACEVRLRVYMSEDDQYDFIGKKDYGTFNQIAIKKMYELVGEASLGEYFLTAFALQEAINNPIRLKHLDCDHSMSFQILSFMQTYKLMFKLWNKQSRDGVIKALNPDDEATIRGCIAGYYKLKKIFVKVLDILNVINEEKITVFDTLFLCSTLKIEALQETGSSSDILTYLKKLVNSLNKGNFFQEDKSLILSYVVSACGMLDGYGESIDFMEQVKRDLQTFSLHNDDMTSHFRFVYEQASIKFKLGLFKEALPLYNECIPAAVYLDDTNGGYESLVIIGNVISCHLMIAMNYSDLEKPQEAIEHLHEAMKLREKYNLDADITYGCLRLLAKCYTQLAQFEEALVQYEKGLDICRNLSEEDGDAWDLKALELKPLIKIATHALQYVSSRS